MGFFRDFKQGFYQAVNELVHGDELDEKNVNTLDNGTIPDVSITRSRLEGCINSDGSVKIGVDSIVIGDKTASSLFIAGAVKGNIDIKEQTMNKYKRVLLKLSGEALAGDKKTGFDESTCIAVANQVKHLVEKNFQVGIVIGGGNFWRGRSSENIDRTKADQIGMLATVMNCLYVSEIFRSVGMKTDIMTPFSCGSMTKLFSKDGVMDSFSDGKVVFLAGGTGHPYFSTDTGVVLRAIELEADVILMAKAVDGVYDCDPAKNPDAKKYDTISLQEALEKQLKVVDLSATVLAMENRMPMLVFALGEENSIINAVSGNLNGTIVTV